MDGFVSQRQFIPECVKGIEVDAALCRTRVLTDDVQSFLP